MKIIFTIESGFRATNERTTVREDFQFTSPKDLSNTMPGKTDTAQFRGEKASFPEKWQLPCSKGAWEKAEKLIYTVKVTVMKRRDLNDSSYIEN